MKKDLIAAQQLLFKRQLLLRKSPSGDSELPKRDVTATQQLEVKKRLLMRSRQLALCNKNFVTEC